MTAFSKLVDYLQSQLRFICHLDALQSRVGWVHATRGRIRIIPRLGSGFDNEVAMAKLRESCQDRETIVGDYPQYYLSSTAKKQC